jgi:hypothetical protein
MAVNWDIAGKRAGIDVPLANGDKLACVRDGLHLFRDDGQPVALLVTSRSHRYPAKTGVEIMAPEREHSEKILRRLVSFTRQGNAYRGHVLLSHTLSNPSKAPERDTSKAATSHAENASSLLASIYTN